MKCLWSVKFWTRSDKTEIEYTHTHTQRGGAKYVLSNYKEKVKLSLSYSLTEHHAIKVYWRSGGITPRVLVPALDGGEW